MHESGPRSRSARCPRSAESTVPERNPSARSCAKNGLERKPGGLHAKDHVMTSSNLVPIGRFGAAHRLLWGLGHAFRAIVAVLRAINHRRDVGRLLEVDERALK